MTDQLTSDERYRVEQIRERWKYAPPTDIRKSEIDFLLSLLDSQAADGERDVDWALRELADGWISNNEREGPHGFYQNARRVLGLIANDAAAAMRTVLWRCDYDDETLRANEAQRKSEQ